MDVLQLKKRSQTFGGHTSIIGRTIPIFGKTALIFGELPNFQENCLNFSEELPQTQEVELRTCLKSNETPLYTHPTSLNFLPKTKCVFSVRRQPEECNIIAYSL